MYFNELITQWEAQTQPTPNQSKRVRSALCRLAEAVGSDDWQTLKILPAEVAEAEVEAYLRNERYASSSRHTYLANVRHIYRWAHDEGVVDRDGQTAEDHWPLLQGKPWASELTRRQRNAYDHFRRFAQGQRISKNEVRPEHLLQWLKHQRTERRDAHYRKHFHRLHEIWPTLVSEAYVPDLKFPELPPPRNRRYALPLENWPAPICKEWENISRRGTSRWNHAGRSSWRKSTVDNYTKLIGRILGWTRSVGRLDDFASLSAVLAPRTIQDYIDWHVERNNRSSLNLGHGATIRAARSITALYLKPDDSVLEEFGRMKREDLTAVVDKAYKMFPYRELEDAVSKAIRLVDRAHEQHKRGRISKDELAAKYVDTIIFTLLVTRGLRSANIRMIRLNKHVIHRDAEIFLRFDKTEMKNHITFETTIPQVLGPIWKRFVEEVRPRVSGPASKDHLLITRKGTPFSAGNFGQRVRTVGRKLVDRDVHPHLYRHLLGCHIARDLKLDPATLQKMLGHKSLNTTFAYYAPVTPAEAARMVDEAFAGKEKRVIG